MFPSRKHWAVSEFVSSFSISVQESLCKNCCRSGQQKYFTNLQQSGARTHTPIKFKTPHNLFAHHSDYKTCQRSTKCTGSVQENRCTRMRGVMLTNTACSSLHRHELLILSAGKQSITDHRAGITKIGCVHKHNLRSFSKEAERVTRVHHVLP